MKMKLSTSKTRVQLRVPYNKDFIEEAHNLAGRFRTRTMMWSFRVSQIQLLKAAVRRIFNEPLEFGHVDKHHDPEGNY